MTSQTYIRSSTSMAPNTSITEKRSVITTSSVSPGSSVSGGLNALDDDNSIYYRSSITPRTSSVFRAATVPMRSASTRSLEITSGMMGGAGLIGGSNATATGVTTYKSTREREKKDMQDLNERFASYIEKVRFLEAQNKKLASELEQLRSHWGKETSAVKQMYETELEEARKLIDETNKEKARLQLRVGQLEEQLDDFQRQLEEAKKWRSQDRDTINKLNQQVSEMEGEVRMLRRSNDALDTERQRDKTTIARLQEELEKLRIDLSNETIARLDSENKYQTLVEEIDFLKNVHEQELKELSALAYRDTTAENREFWKNELSQAIRDIQQEYDLKVDQIRGEMETFYNLKVQEFRTGATKQNMEVTHAREETKKLHKQISDSRSRLSDLEARNAQLEKQYQDLLRELDQKDSDHVMETNSLKEEMNSLRLQMEGMLVELQTLMDAKLSLELEIAAYRKLLEGEETRIPLRSSIWKSYTPNTAPLLDRSHKTESKRPSSSPTTTNTTTTTTGVSSKSSLFPRSSATTAPVSSIDIQESSASSDQVDILVDDREEKTPACVDDACVYPTNSSTKMGLSTESLGFSSQPSEDVAQCHEEGRTEGVDKRIDTQDDDSKSSAGFKEEENIASSSGQECETVPVLETMVVETVPEVKSAPSPVLETMVVETMPEVESAPSPVLETMVVGTVPEVKSAPLVSTDSARFEIVNGTNDIDDDDVEVEEHEEEVHYEIFAQTQGSYDINEDGGEALAVDSVVIEKQIHEPQPEHIESGKSPEAYHVEPREEHANDNVLTGVQKDDIVSEESMPPKHVDKSDTLLADVKQENLEEYEKRNTETSENQIESNVPITEKALSGTGEKQDGFDEHLSENNAPVTFEKQAKFGGPFSGTVIPGADESKGHVHTMSDQTDSGENAVVSIEFDQTTLEETNALEEKNHRDSKDNIVAQVVEEQISAELQSKQSSAVTTVASSADVDVSKEAAASDRCKHENIDTTFIQDISTDHSEDMSGKELISENAVGDKSTDNNAEPNYKKKSNHIPDADKDISTKTDLGTIDDAKGAFPPVQTEQNTTSDLSVEHPVGVASRMAPEESEKSSEFGQVPEFAETVEFKDVEAPAASTDAGKVRESAMHIKSEDPIELEKTTESVNCIQSEIPVEISNVAEESAESVAHVKSSVSTEKKKDIQSERPIEIEEPNESNTPSESGKLVESEKSLQLECSVKETENSASSSGNLPSSGGVEDQSENSGVENSTQKSNTCPEEGNEPEHPNCLSAPAANKVEIQISTMREIADESSEGMVNSEGKDTQIISQSCSDVLFKTDELKKGSSDIETSDHNANPTMGNKELQVEVEVHSDAADKPSEDFTIDAKEETSEDTIRKQATSSKQEVNFDIKSTKVTRSHEQISADIIKSEMDEEEMLLEVGANEDLLDESSPDISLIHPIKAELNKITYTDNDTDNDGLDDDEMVDTEDRERYNAKDEVQDKQKDNDDLQKSESLETVTMSQSSTTVSTKVCSSENILKTISNETMQDEMSETNADNVASNNTTSKDSLNISKHQDEDDSSDSVFDTETLEDKVKDDKIRPAVSSEIDSEHRDLTESHEQDNAKPNSTGNDAKTDDGVDPVLSTIVSDIHITETKSVTVVSASSSECTTVVNRNILRKELDDDCNTLRAENDTSGVKESADISRSEDILDKEGDFSADANLGSIGPVGEQSEQCDQSSDQVGQKINTTPASSNSSDTSQEISSSKQRVTSLDETSSGSQDTTTTFVENKAIHNTSMATTDTRPLEIVGDIIIAHPDTTVNHSHCPSNTSQTADQEIADVSLKLAMSSSHDMTISDDSIAKDTEPSAQEDIPETKDEENRETETNTSSISSINEVNISEISEQSTPVLEGRPGSVMDIITMPEQDSVALHETIKEIDEISIHEGSIDNPNAVDAVEESRYDESLPKETKSAETVDSKQMETIISSESAECNVEITRSKAEALVVGDTSSDGVQSQTFQEETIVATVSKSDTKLVSSADKIKDDNVVVNGKEALTSPDT